MSSAPESEGYYHDGFPEDGPYMILPESITAQYTFHANVPWITVDANRLPKLFLQIDAQGNELAPTDLGISLRE